MIVVRDFVQNPVCLHYFDASLLSLVVAYLISVDFLCLVLQLKKCPGVPPMYSDCVGHLLLYGPRSRDWCDRIIDTDAEGTEAQNHLLRYAGKLGLTISAILVAD